MYNPSDKSRNIGRRWTLTLYARHALFQELLLLHHIEHETRAQWEWPKVRRFCCVASMHQQQRGSLSDHESVQLCVSSRRIQSSSTLCKFTALLYTHGHPSPVGVVSWHDWLFPGRCFQVSGLLNTSQKFTAHRGPRGAASTCVFCSTMDFILYSNSKKYSKYYAHMHACRYRESTTPQKAFGLRCGTLKISLRV